MKVDGPCTVYFSTIVHTLYQKCLPYSVGPNRLERLKEGMGRVELQEGQTVAFLLLLSINLHNCITVVSMAKI